MMEIELTRSTNYSIIGDDDGAADMEDVADPFWSLDQRALIESFPYGAHLLLGFIVSIIGSLGLAANSTVLIIFSRFRRLRNPANIFIINLALADVAACCLHSMAAYSNFNGRWAFGRSGCQLYALGVGLFGLVSILTFSAIAVERCLVIASAPITLAKWKITRPRAKLICCWIWLYCGALVVLPLFGLSAYVPEGLLTSCSWDYSTRTSSNRVYYVLLLFTGFFLPVSLTFGSYGCIVASIFRHAKLMNHVSSSNVFTLRTLRRRMEVRTTQIFVALFVVYLTAWTPYAVVTLIGQFGEEGVLNPYTTAIPAYFAKMAVLIDPFVYGFGHPRFRASFKQYVSSFRLFPAGGEEPVVRYLVNHNVVMVDGLVEGSSTSQHHQPRNRRMLTRDFSSLESSSRTVAPTPILVELPADLIEELRQNYGS